MDGTASRKGGLQHLEACPLSDQEFLALLTALDKELEDELVDGIRNVSLELRASPIPRDNDRTADP